jgi:2-hydroxychromene-2-carboxylate isomerase
VASTRVEALAERVGARLDARPMLLGGVFQARGTPQNLSQTLAPAKARHNLADMQRQAAGAGVPLVMPAGHPLRTVDALRCVLAAGEPFMPLVHRFYRAYWAEGRDIGRREVVAAVVRRGGARRRGGAGAGGQRRGEGGAAAADRRGGGARGVRGADDVRRRRAVLGGGSARYGRGGARWIRCRSGRRRRAPVDLYFDYSSPFAYLALTQAEAVFGAAARWRPILLGGLFRSIGTADVPLFTQSPEKRAHTLKDLERQARRFGVGVRWPSRFPVNTVLALRLSLGAGLTESRRGGR